MSTVIGWFFVALLFLFVVPISLCMLVNVYVFIYNEMMKHYRNLKRGKDGKPISRVRL